MTKLWTDHTTHIHDHNTFSSPIKSQDLQRQIRALHSLKPKVLAVHRDRYFFNNVEDYLLKATPGQMTRYIDRYQPVILHSLRQASKVSTAAHPTTSFFHRSTTPHHKPSPQSNTTTRGGKSSKTYQDKSTNDSTDADLLSPDKTLPTTTTTTYPSQLTS